MKYTVCPLGGYIEALRWRILNWD